MMRKESWSTAPTPHALEGCLVGCAAADSIGLPYEGLTARRASRMLGEPERHRLLFGRGMVSDDTEHAIMTGAAFVESNGDVGAFSRDLARRLRWWMVAMPAGVGFATLRACLKLWCGVDPSRSGIRSAGNGPAMRAPVLGVLSRSREELEQFVLASTRITHTDVRAEAGALAIALEAFRAARGLDPSPEDTLLSLERMQGAEMLQPMIESIRRAADSIARAEPTNEIAASLGLRNGVSGFVVHTVPVCLHACWTNPNNFEAAVQSVIRSGGDADTTAAIVGGVVGARVGVHGIPERWRARLLDLAWVERWVQRIGTVESVRPTAATTLARIPRNVGFAAVVIAHGLRRLLPPYG